jgi:Reverse transcriptase (RNA-dependent DNA polymerase)
MCGEMIIVRFADDYIVGFEYQRDARRFLDDLRERLAKFSLELAAEKTRLIEFGRFASERRAARGLGKPETFGFLGFTHICGKTTDARVSTVERYAGSLGCVVQYHLVPLDPSADEPAVVVHESSSVSKGV